MRQFRISDYSIDELEDYKEREKHEGTDQERD